MRRSNRSKFLALFLSFAFAVQLLPTMALASESTDEPLIKEAGYQDFPAYYSDSAHADNQVTHPDVVVLNEEWNGHRYWAIYTPNVMNISIYENPSIVASDDGVHWVEPEGLSNPIEPQPPNTRYHDGEFVESAYTYGEPGSGKLIFDATGLVPGTHTIRIVNTTVQPIDIDYFAFASEDAPEPDPVYQIVDDRDPALVYSGTWADDNNVLFHGETARYTSAIGAEVTFSFEGTAVRWYGQHDTNFGTAKVYLDDELVEIVSVNGDASVKELLFERSGLESGVHVLRIVCETPVIDIDYFEYAE